MLKALVAACLALAVLLPASPASAARHLGWLFPEIGLGWRCPDFPPES